MYCSKKFPILLGALNKFFICGGWGVIKYILLGSMDLPSTLSECFAYRARVDRYTLLQFLTPPLRTIELVHIASSNRFFLQEPKPALTKTGSDKVPIFVSRPSMYLL